MLHEAVADLLRVNARRSRCRVQRERPPRSAAGAV